MTATMAPRGILAFAVCASSSIVSADIADGAGCAMVVDLRMLGEAPVNAFCTAGYFGTRGCARTVLTSATRCPLLQAR